MTTDYADGTDEEQDPFLTSIRVIRVIRGSFCLIHAANSLDEDAPHSAVLQPANAANRGHRARALVKIKLGTVIGATAEVTERTVTILPAKK